MAGKNDPSIYDDRSTIGSSDELDEYGVWVKSEPEDLGASLPEIGDLPDLDAGFVKDLDPPDFSGDAFPGLDEPEIPDSPAPDFGDLDFDDLGLDNPFGEAPGEGNTPDGPAPDAEALGIPPPDPTPETGVEAAAENGDEEDFAEMPLVDLIGFEDPISGEPAMEDEEPPPGGEPGKDLAGEGFTKTGFPTEEAARFSAAPPSPNAVELSNQLLMKIADELSSIKTELSSLKKELAVVRVEPKGEGTEAKGGGFFDEEEDEKIALTGDEMDTILNTANFTGETGAGEAIHDGLPPDAGSAAGLDDLSGSDISPGLESAPAQDDFSDPSGLTGQDDLSGLDALSGLEGSPAQDELSDPSGLTGQDDLSGLDALSGLESSPTQDDFSDLSGLTGLDDLSGSDALSGLESSPAQDDFSDLGDVTGLDDLSGLDTIPGLDEAFLSDGVDILGENPAEEPPGPENLTFEEVNIPGLDGEIREEDALKDLDEDFDMAMNFGQNEPGGPEESPDELGKLQEPEAPPLSAAPEDSSYLEEDPLSLGAEDSIDLSGAVIDEPDLSAGIMENPVTEPAIENISIDLDMEDSTGSGENFLSMPGTGPDDFTFETEDTMEIPPPDGGGEDFNLPGKDLETLNLSAGETIPGEDLLKEDAPPPPAAESFPAAPGAAVSPAAAALGEEIPSNLKRELKTVLSYMDRLLESLPEEKIEEFAKSEYFDTYKKLFEELGLV
ncbi:MAG: MSCRAMM family adhesin SdrC [Treponema sp.]|jgi:hypothetical protein|nr:MSCRAMM family adhesin SdrC [Treponema sp.]